MSHASIRATMDDVDLDADELPSELWAKDPTPGAGNISGNTEGIDSPSKMTQTVRR